MEKDALRFGCYPQSPRPQAVGSLGAEYEEDLDFDLALSL